MKLDSLDIGQPGYTALMLQRAAPMALELEGLFEPAMIAGVATPSGWLADHAEDGGPIGGLMALIDDHFGRFTAYVAYANSSYVHASRIDAMEAMLELRSAAQLVSMSRQLLEEAREYAMLKGVDGVPLAPAVPLQDAFKTACVALGEVMTAYFGYQRQMLRFDRIGGADDPTRAQARTAAQAVHRALGTIMEIPPSMPHAAPGRLVNAQAGPVAAAALFEIANLMDQHESAAAAAAGAAATQVEAAIRDYLERAEMCQRAMLAARAAYLALGTQLDRLAAKGTERFAVEIAVAAQTREVLAVSRGVRAAFGSSQDWDDVSARVDAACAECGVEPPQAHRDAFAAVRQQVLRYEGGSGSFETNFGAIDQSLGEFFGATY